MAEQGPRNRARREAARAAYEAGLRAGVNYPEFAARLAGLAR